MNSAFVNVERPLSEGGMGTGKGGYWRVSEDVSRVIPSGINRSDSDRPRHHTEGVPRNRVLRQRTTPTRQPSPKAPMSATPRRQTSSLRLTICPSRSRCHSRTTHRCHTAAPLRREGSGRCPLTSPSRATTRQDRSLCPLTRSLIFANLAPTRPSSRPAMSHYLTGATFTRLCHPPALFSRLRHTRRTAGL